MLTRPHLSKRKDLHYGQLVGDKINHLGLNLLSVVQSVSIIYQEIRKHWVDEFSFVDFEFEKIFNAMNWILSNWVLFHLNVKNWYWYCFSCVNILPGGRNAVPQQQHYGGQWKVGEEECRIWWQRKF